MGTFWNQGTNKQVPAEVSVRPTGAAAKNKKQLLAPHRPAALFIFYKALLIWLFALEPLQHEEKLPV